MVRRGRRRGRGASCPTGCASGPRRPGWCKPERCRRAGKGTEGRAGAGGGSYLPARRCHRVAFSIFLCFFLRIRLRRFLISDPMSCGRLAVLGVDCQVGPGSGGSRGLRDRPAGPRATGHARGPGGRGGGVLRGAARAGPPAQARATAPVVAAGSRRGRWRSISVSRRTSAPPARPIRPWSSGTCPLWKTCCVRPAWRCDPIPMLRRVRAPTSTIPSATGSS